MDAHTLSLLDFIQNGNPFEIPVYQRAYSWNDENCEKLWKDVMRVGKDDNNRTHFVGAVIYIENADSQGRAKRFIIDGQQRIATVTLLIEALARSLDAGGTVNGMSADVLRAQYIFNPNEFGVNAYRLLLNKKDRETLKAVLDSSRLPDVPSLNIQKNFQWFVLQFNDAGTDETRRLIYNGLRRLNIVAAELEKRDEPQAVFENMNTKKRSLTMSDLIRNYVLLDMAPDDQTELYEKHWRPIEKGFDQKTFSKNFDDFIRYYLAFKNAKMPRKYRLYAEFQDFASARNTEGIRRGAVMKNIVADLQEFAGYFCKMKLEREENPNLKKRFQAFQEINANTLFPLLLGMYDDYAANGLLSAAQFEVALGMLESFMLRRAVCGISDGINKAAPRYHSRIRSGQYLESLSDLLRGLPTSERFPDDAEFRRNLIQRDIGSLRPCAYFLRRLENYERDEPIDLDGYEVERIMPQLSKSGGLSDDWKRALGPDWQYLHELYVDSLGNLTLMKDFADFAQEPFSIKWEAYRDSGLRLNNGPKGPARVEQWKDKAIADRAEILAQRALEVWPYP